MAFRFKFVATALVLVLLAGTGSLFAACAAGTSPAGKMDCPPDCPMMTAHHSAVTEQVQSDEHHGASCCQISSSKPVQIVSFPPLNVTVAPPQVKGAPEMQLPTAPEEAAASVPLALDVSPQAVLCTFLI
jgi:hypothetical protein